MVFQEGLVGIMVIIGVSILFMGFEGDSLFQKWENVNSRRAVNPGKLSERFFPWLKGGKDVRKLYLQA